MILSFSRKHDACNAFVSFRFVSWDRRSVPSPCATSSRNRCGSPTGHEIDHVMALGGNRRWDSLQWNGKGRTDQSRSQQVSRGTIRTVRFGLRRVGRDEAGRQRLATKIASVQQDRRGKIQRWSRAWAGLGFIRTVRWRSWGWEGTSCTSRTRFRVHVGETKSSRSGVNTKDDVHVLSDSVDTNDEPEEVVHPLRMGMDRLVCTIDAISLH